MQYAKNQTKSGQRSRNEPLAVPSVGGSGPMAPRVAYARVCPHRATGHPIG